MPHVWRRNALRNDSHILEFTIRSEHRWVIQADELGFQIVCFDKQDGAVQHLVIEGLTLAELVTWSRKEWEKLYGYDPGRGHR